MFHLPGSISHPTRLGGLTDKVKQQTKLDQLAAVCAFFKAFRYIGEIGTDEWCDIDQFLLRGGGDCEDFALAGYRILRGLGWDYADLAIVSGTLDNGEAHAMLAAVIEDVVYYIDQRKCDYFRAGSDRAGDFKPFSSTNEAGTTIHTPMPQVPMPPPPAPPPAS